MHWSWTYRKNLKKERIQCNVFFLVKTLIVTLSSLFPKVILWYYICKGRGNYAATKTSLQFKQQYNYQIMTKLHNNYTRMTACHAPTTFINKVQFSKNGNWLRSWLTLTTAPAEFQVEFLFCEYEDTARDQSCHVSSYSDPTLCHRQPSKRFAYKINIAP